MNYTGSGAFNVTGSTCGVSANGNASAAVSSATATSGGGNGAFAISGGHIVVNGSVQGGYNGVFVSGPSSTAVVNGDATGTASDSSGARTVFGGSIVINDGTVQGVLYGAYANGSEGGSSSSITINGGDVIGTGPNSDGVYAVIYGTVNVGGNVQGAQNGVISSDNTVVVVTGNVTVTADVNGYGVNAQSDGTIAVGGNVVANGSSMGAFVVSGGEITIDGAILASNYIRIFDNIAEEYVYKDGSEASRTTPTTKEGYYTYFAGTSTVWVKIPAALTVTFNSNGSVYATKSVNAGESIGSEAWPTEPTRSGYIFGGWFTGANGSGTQFTSATPVNTIMTVYAKWTFKGGSGGGGGGGNTVKAPSVVTGNAGSITTGSAVLNGEISARGGTAITGYGFSYSSDEKQWTEVKAGSGDLLGSFSYTLDGLSPNTVYYFKAYAANAAGKTYGKAQSFMALEEQAPHIPAAQTVLSFYIGQNDYYVNDQVQAMDTAPVILGGRTMLPVRFIAEALDAAVDWDGNERKVTIVLNDQTIELWIGRNMARVNGVETPIDAGNPDVKPFISASGRTMLPLRFIAQTLGCQVEWDPVTQEVKVTYPANP